MILDVPAVTFFENGDGEYYVPVAEEPDQRRAWLRAEASTSVALVPAGRQTLPCGDCEMDHHCGETKWDGGCDAHPGCPKTPCPPPESTDVWLFLNVDDHDEYRAGLAFAWEESDVARADAPSPLRAEGAPDEGARLG